MLVSQSIRQAIGDQPGEPDEQRARRNQDQRVDRDWPFAAHRGQIVNRHTVSGGNTCEERVGAFTLTQVFAVSTFSLPSGVAKANADLLGKLDIVPQVLPVDRAGRVQRACLVLRRLAMQVQPARWDDRESARKEDTNDKDRNGDGYRRRDGSFHPRILRARDQALGTGFRLRTSGFRRHRLQADAGSAAVVAQSLNAQSPEPKGAGSSRRRRAVVRSVARDRRAPQA